MFREEKQFVFRFSLEATFSEDYDGEAENFGWLQDWERSLKPELMRMIFDTLRRQPGWTVHVRNRGVSPTDEIEIAMCKEFGTDETAPGQPER